ncbi:unnamed protein product, partial [Amoebophrya sp. A120]|eukprot:GSA120T00022068001.1
MLSRAIGRGLRANQSVTNFSQRTAQRQFADAAAKPKALGQSTATQTPILYYNSTQQATSSINHRMFYVNVVGMIRCDRLIHYSVSNLVYDVFHFYHCSAHEKLSQTTKTNSNDGGRGCLQYPGGLLK